MENKVIYEKPIAEIIEFELEDSIAFSINLGPGLSCTEEYWEV